MPGFVPILNTVKIALDILLAGQSLINTFHIARSASWDTGDMSTLITSFSNWLTDNIKGVVCDNLSWRGAYATDLTAVDAPSFYESFAAPIVGTKTGEAVPLNVAGVISELTNRRGRSYRGRSYLPGIAESDRTSEGAFTSALAAAIAAGYGTLNLYVGPDTGGAHVVASRFNAGVQRAEGVAQNVNAYRMDTLFDSQRRRLIGRGT